MSIARESSSPSSGRPAGPAAIVRGADSGMGRAEAALSFASAAFVAGVVLSVDAGSTAG